MLKNIPGINQKFVDFYREVFLVKRVVHGGAEGS